MMWIVNWVTYRLHVPSSVFLHSSVLLFQAQYFRSPGALLLAKGDAILAKEGDMILERCSYVFFAKPIVDFVMNEEGIRDKRDKCFVPFTLWAVD